MPGQPSSFRRSAHLRGPAPAGAIVRIATQEFLREVGKVKASAGATLPVP
jgi:hypothetical protein